VRRTRAQLAVADLALVVVDASAAAGPDAGLMAEIPPGIPVLKLRHMADLSGETPGPVPGQPDTLAVSARTGAGIPELRRAILARVGYDAAGEGTVTARQRHVEILNRARAHFDTGRRQLADARAGELLAEELREVQNALAEITGEFSSDDLLGKIFGEFCIGK
jgi:tRNA modification GTPase